ncbi:MAG: esterase-like activity of phytase family protein [Saprospiraceae bacterium]|nr:esterase-like activity of phytase family protein [Saprospiraceae bacterium]
MSNEISGTVSVFQIELDRTNGDDFTLETYDYTPTTTIVDFNGGTIFDGGISGLHHIPGTDLEFYAVSDRGPNAVASSHPNATGNTLLFPKPDYAPVITRFKAENGAWTVQGIEEIKRPDGTPISGLPLPTGAGNTGEIAWSDTSPTVIAPDVWGMDTEGIVEDNFGNLWLCDEYGASVWKIKKTTKQVIKRYTPFPTQPQDAPLPAVIGKRRANRGFEGVAITPNGKVYSMIQSVADNPNTAAGNNGRLLRLVEIDPETDAVRQFAYEIQPVTGQIRTRDWKVGDLVAVNNNEFLLVEHAELNGWNVKNIYKINISNATPLTTDDFGGQTLEQVGTAAGVAAFGVNVVEKTLVLDLLEAGWDLSHDKPEGLTIIDDNTIAVVNDNDFGINSPAGDGTIVFTGKTTRLYIYGLSEPLGYVSPYCTYDYPVAIAAGCEGDNITLDAGAGFAAYKWEDGSTGQTLGVTAEGMYSVTVTNAVGCKAIDSVTVVVNANPVIDLGADATFCSNEDLTLNAGAGFVGYLWSDNSNGQTLNVTTAGTYEVVVEDANGCLGADAITLTTIPAPVPNLGNVTQAICAGQFLNLDAGAGFATYEWSTGATTQTIQVTTAGEYGVLVSAANGCFGSDAVEVVVNPTPTVSLGDNQTICEGENATLTAGAGFSSYAWSTGATGQSIQVTQTGTYSVVVSNSFGCTNLDAATVFVNPAPDVDLGPDTVVYEPKSYLLDAGSGFNQTYLWSNGATSQTITVTADGTYSVTITSSSGCTSTDEVTVSIQPNAVNEPTLAGKLALFPNPTSGRVNLAFSEFEAGGYTVGVYDVTGRLLLSQNLDIQTAAQTARLDLNRFPKGAYLVKIGSEKGMMVRRVVVQ